MTVVLSLQTIQSHPSKNALPVYSLQWQLLSLSRTTPLGNVIRRHILGFLVLLAFSSSGISIMILKDPNLAIKTWGSA